MKTEPDKSDKNQKKTSWNNNFITANGLLSPTERKISRPLSPTPSDSQAILTSSPQKTAPKLLDEYKKIKIGFEKIHGQFEPPNQNFLSSLDPK